MFHITQPLDSIRYMVYNGYYKVMSNIPKMGHLTTPEVIPQKKNVAETGVWFNRTVATSSIIWMSCSTTLEARCITKG